jgi:hypothetical protein
MTGTNGQAISNNSGIQPEHLKELLDYNPETGLFTWKARTGQGPGRDVEWKVWNGRNAGRPAFTAKLKSGYRVGNIYGKTMLAHRVAFAMTHGFWPEEDVDHVNRDRGDNRAGNLRAATRGQNMANAVYSTTSEYGRGVRTSEGPRGAKWSARIGKQHLGTFRCPTAAMIAHAKASVAKFGDRSIYAREVRHA